MKKASFLWPFVLTMFLLLRSPVFAFESGPALDSPAQELAGKIDRSRGWLFNGTEPWEAFEALSKSRTGRLFSSLGLLVDKHAPSLIRTKAWAGTEAVIKELRSALLQSTEGQIEALEKQRPNCEAELRKKTAPQNEAQETLLRGTMGMCKHPGIVEAAKRLNNSINEATRVENDHRFLTSLFKTAFTQLKAQHAVSQRIDEAIGALPPLSEDASEEGIVNRLLLDCRLRESAIRFLVDTQATYEAFILMQPRFSSRPAYAKMQDTLRKTREKYARVVSNQMDGRMHGACP